MTPREKLAKLLNHEFSQSQLLEQALTHRSFGSRNNERLEFLGDSILGFVVADKLYQAFPESPEGVLTRLRATIVCGETLAAIAREIGLGRCLKVGAGEAKSGGYDRDSILADSLEALIGALYLDGGLHAARTFVEKQFAASLKAVDPTAVVRDPKSRLQEHLQHHGLAIPSYEVVDTQGPPHKRFFTVHCRLSQIDRNFVGEARSRRAAEQQAAENALGYLISVS